MSNLIEYTLICDFKRPLKSQIVNLEKDDAGSVAIRLMLNNGSEAFDMSNITYAQIYAVKPDETSVIYDSVTIEKDDDGNNKSVVSYIVPENMTDHPGQVTANIMLFGADGYVKSTPKFYLNIGSQLFDPDEYVSSSTITSMQTLVSDVSSALAELKNTTAIKNPYALSITKNNTTVSYDGSTVQSIAFETRKNLTTTTEGDALDASQGPVITKAIAAAKSEVEEDVTALTKRVKTAETDIDTLETGIAAKLPGLASIQFKRAVFDANHVNYWVLNGSQGVEDVVVYFDTPMTGKPVVIITPINNQNHAVSVIFQELIQNSSGKYTGFTVQLWNFAGSSSMLGFNYLALETATTA